MLLVLLTILTQTPTVPMRCATPLFESLKAGGLPPAPKPRPAGERLRVGDSRVMWLQNMSVMPPVQFQASLTCRAVGPHCYVMVEDSAWNAGQVDSADVARIVERFDFSSPRDSTKGVWGHNTSVLGMPPDAIDNDSAIYLLYYDVGSFHGYSFDGFWQYFDQYYDTTAMRLWGYHSNEVECVYLDCWPNNPAGDYRIAIVAHEFGHMIHWNYDPAESLWVVEGNCELAMWLYGTPDPVSSFPSNPDNDLTSWTGAWADYIKTYLFFLYLYEQYGGRVGLDLIHNVIASPFVSIEGIDSAFAATGRDERFTDVFDSWVLANRINDTSFAGGRYGYYGERVPRFGVAGYHFTFPVARSGDLNRWAGEYILFQGGTGLAATFDAADNADFRLFVVGLDTVRRRLFLDTITLDSAGRADISVPGFGTDWQSVYLVPVNHTLSGRRSYSYTANASGLAEATSAGRGRLSVPTVCRAGDLRPGLADRLFAADGRVIRSPAELKPGVYWLKAGEEIRRVVLVP